MDIITLGFKAALFDTKSSVLLAKRIHPHALWTFKFSVTFFYVGFLLGGYRHSYKRAHQFLAENQHRLPTTKAGWYMYHKHKNYAIIKSFVGQGTRVGLTMAGWTMLYGAMEYLFIYGNGEHWFNGAGAGLLSGDKLWSSTTRFVLGGSMLTGLVFTGLQELYKRQHGLSIKEFDPKLIEQYTENKESL